MMIPEADLLKQIVSDYAIGSLAGFQRLTLGYVNTSYIITMQDGHKYLLRIYRQGIEESELLFEHSIINHLVARGFDLTAAVLPCTEGRTYVRRSLDGRSKPGKKDGIYCALFSFLPGEDRFTWIKPECSPAELAESAAALARFHDAVIGLTPAGRRVEPDIMTMLPQIDAGITARLARRRDNVFENTLAENQELVLGAIARLKAAIDAEALARTPHLVIHGDYHPGNLKFDGDRVVGLFDLDWSKVDARAFDLGLALTYFCATWDTAHPADYFRLDRAAVFLKTYQDTAARLTRLPPLNTAEVDLLPAMCAAGNVYVLEWALRDFYSREVNPLEYLGFLQHHLCLMRWYDDEANQARLRAMLAESVCPVDALPTGSSAARQGKRLP